MLGRLRILATILFLAVIVLLMVCQSAFAAPMSASDDTNLGRVTVENDIYKAIWQYKTNALQNNNQSGGNLYGLYFKATDPSCGNNLVALANYGNKNSVIWAGIGGSGQTAMYASDVPPGSTGNYSWADLIGDNNLSGVLVGHSVQQTSGGAVSASFTFDIKNQSTQVTWYEVTKNWTAYPDGQITLSESRRFLHGGYISEPRTTFTWNKNGGWKSFEKYGYDWGQNQTASKLVTINGIDQVNGETWDALNRFYPLWARLAGSTTAPDITVEAVGGIQASGLYNLGQTVWNGPPGATMEQSVYSNPNPKVTAYAMAWMGWWGGNPPDGSRYRFVPSQTTLADNYEIILGQQPVEMQNLPQVSNVAISQLDAKDATLTWTTTSPSSSTVNYVENGQTQVKTAIAANLTTQHSVTISGLNPDTSYQYTVGDNSSIAIQGNGSFQTSSTASEIALSVALDGVYWGSLQDYQSRTLTVNYLVINNGSNNVQSVDIIENRLSNGVVELTLPVHIENLQSGQASLFAIHYRVPPGVSLFQSDLLGTAVDTQGNNYPFPS